MPSMPLAKTKSPADQVCEWMVRGHREADIAEAVAAMFPGADPKPLMEAAVNHFVSAAHCQKDVVTGWAMEAYRELYRNLLSIGDFPGAARVVGELVKLAQKLPDSQEI